MNPQPLAELSPKFYTLTLAKYKFTTEVKSPCSRQQGGGPAKQLE
jgi:hypothetical protein